MTTHNSIRYTLFYDTLKKIKAIEYHHMKNKKDTFKFVNIEILESNNVDKLIDLFKQYYYNVQLIRVIGWKYKRNNTDSFYKVKYYQDLKNESFYCQVIPLSYYDKLVNYYNNFFNKY